MKEAEIELMQGILDSESHDLYMIHFTSHSEYIYDTS